MSFNWISQHFVEPVVSPESIKKPEFSKSITFIIAHLNNLKTFFVTEKNIIYNYYKALQKSV